MWTGRRPRAPLTGNCDIREHTADGAYVGRCEFATYGHVCPRHGMLVDYPTRDDREVAVADRRMSATKPRPKAAARKTKP